MSAEEPCAHPESVQAFAVGIVERITAALEQPFPPYICAACAVVEALDATLADPYATKTMRAALALARAAQLGAQRQTDLRLLEIVGVVPKMRDASPAKEA